MRTVNLNGLHFQVLDNPFARMSVDQRRQIAVEGEQRMKLDLGLRDAAAWSNDLFEHRGLATKAVGNPNMQEIAR